MLVNLNEVLKYAEERNCGIGSFNTPNLECLLAVVRSAEKYNVPVIIMHAECHEPWSHLEDIGPVMLTIAKGAKVPVCVHLDHCEHIDYLKRAIELGFTSVMIDASSKSYEENVALTKETVAYARPRNVSVEAEIGILGGRESGDCRPLSKEEMYTDPLVADKFVKETNVDALACSFGTAHGIYKERPQLDFPRIRKIRELVKIPLVMHGGSGVPPEDFVTAIDCGVRKFNYYSYMARAGVYAARDYLIHNNVTFYHEVAKDVEDKMAENIAIPMKLLARIKD